MQFLNAGLQLAGPSGAVSIYGKIMRATESPREIEYRVFAQVPTALADAEPPDAHFPSRSAALHRHREL